MSGAVIYALVFLAFSLVTAVVALAWPRQSEERDDGL